MTIKSFLPVFPGFYNTIFEPDESLILEDHPSKEFDDFEFDYKEYYNDVGLYSCDAIQKACPFKIGIKFEKVHSPKFYNYGNDSIHCEYVLTKRTLKQIKEYLIENQDFFSGYLKRYISGPGFTSFYSSNAEQWLYNYWDDIKEHAHYFGSIMEFIMDNEGYDYWRLYDDITGLVYLNYEIKEIA